MTAVVAVVDDALVRGLLLHAPPKTMIAVAKVNRFRTSRRAPVPIGGGN